MNTPHRNNQVLNQEPSCCGTTLPPTAPRNREPVSETLTSVGACELLVSPCPVCCHEANECWIKHRAHSVFACLCIYSMCVHVRAIKLASAASSICDDDVNQEVAEVEFWEYSPQMNIPIKSIKHIFYFYGEHQSKEAQRVVYTCSSRTTVI